MRQVFCLAHQAARDNAIQAIKTAPEGYFVEIKAKTRTLEQNALLWAMLHDLARQVDWHGETLSPEDWKNLFSASLKKQKMVHGLDGGLVVLAQSTSKMTVGEMGDLITLIQAFAANRGVTLAQ